jgi:flagellar hook-associated protein FlgK
VLGSSRSSLDTLANNFVKQVNAIHSGGIDAYGNNGVDLFTISSSGVGAAGTVKVNINDALKVSAAAQFRVIEAPNNTSGTDASIAYVGDPSNGPPSITTALVNNPSAAAAITVKPTISRPVAAVATIPNGLTNISVLMGEADAGQQLQIFTRDGRQLAGTSVDTATQALIMTGANGFAANATYSSAYLNVNGPDSYKDIQVFYGAKAITGTVLQADATEIDPSKHTTLAKVAVAATLQSDRIQTGLTSISGGLFKLNGTLLNGIAPATAGNTLQASDIATGITDSMRTNGITGTTATAKNEIRIPITQLKLDLPLSLKSGSASNFTEIKAVPTGLTSVQGLIDAINTKSTASGVRAYLGDDGDVVLTNIAGSEGKDIAIDGAATPNTLAIKAGNYGGKISITRALVDGTDTPIELGFANGTPSDLAKMGFKTGAYLSGTANEDLLVFVTGVGEAKVSTGYSGEPVSAKQALRTQPLQLKFDSPTHFTIVDVNTNTKVAERNFDPNFLEPALNYQGIQISFSTPPKAGDVFNIDGNKDGTGNNENMLQLVDLESEPVMGGGKTFSASYIDNVNDLGNIARQATISQSALKVVYDQAVTARDQVSGVSLDEEAADLVRYQQAYQAAAKILQVASQLFDSVLQVR